jgi:hypothetical protein
LNDDRAWAEHQPRDGDILLACGHLRSRETTWHWFGVKPPLSFVRPDGTSDKAKWIVACNACFDDAEGDVDRLEIKTDGVWQGDEPVIPAPN